MTQIENQQITNLSNKIEEQNIRLEAQNLRLEAIHSALLGNNISQDGGLVKRIERVEAIVKIVLDGKSKLFGILWFITCLGGVIGTIYAISTIWKNFFKQ